MTDAISPAATSAGGGFSIDPSTLKTIGTVGTGLLGAAASRDQTQSANRDPWGPGQPLLKQVIEQAQGLATQYQANPFNDAQKAGYGNVYGLLNSLGQQAPGLLSAYAGRGSGYDKNSPTRTRVSTQVPTISPGLLSLFNFGK